MKDALTIEALAQDDLLTVSDSIGRVVYEQKIVGLQTFQVDVRDWKPGIYAAKVGASLIVVVKE